MKPLLKKILIVSGTLSLIAGGSALLIGLTNAVTAPVISKNESKKLQSSLGKVFEDVVEISKQTYSEINLDKEYQYIDSKKYEVKDGSKSVGFIYQTSGKNSHGEIKLLIGVEQKNNKFVLHKVVDLKLEQTPDYRTALYGNYLTKINSGERDYQDVRCGSTESATLIKKMIDEVTNDANGIQGTDPKIKVFSDYDPKYTKDNISMEKITLPDGLTYIKEIYEVRYNSGLLGYLYKVEGQGTYTGEEDNEEGSLSMYVGCIDGEIIKAEVIENTYSYATTFEEEYLKNVNNSNYTNVNCGATYTATLAKNMIKEILDHQKSIISGYIKALYSDKTLTFDPLTFTKTNNIKNIYITKENGTEFSYVYKVNGSRTWENEEQEEDTIYMTLCVSLSKDISNNTVVDKVLVIDNTSAGDYKSKFDSDYIAKINDKTLSYSTTVSGATNSSALGQTLIKAAVDDYTTRKV